jgi:hypothetical protein
MPEITADIITNTKTFKGLVGTENRGDIARPKIVDKPIKISIQAIVFIIFFITI